MRSMRIKRGNHLEEVLVDQAQTRVSCTAPFGGDSHTRPQDMVFDVQPFVSLFSPIKGSPSGFLYFEAPIP